MAERSRNTWLERCCPAPSCGNVLALVERATSPYVTLAIMGIAVALLAHLHTRSAAWGDGDARAMPRITDSLDVAAVAGVAACLLWCFAAAALPSALAFYSGPLQDEEEEEDVVKKPSPDVIIVGFGTAGASLAAVLARGGKRVVVLERARELQPTIKGELLQPGGVRALERMGLGACVKGADLDAVRVDGYVCLTPASTVTATAAAAADLVLSYPRADPTCLREYMGCMSRVGATPRNECEDDIVTRAALNGVMGSVGTSVTEQVNTSTGSCDASPHGRSFHNVRFVAQLRAAALAQPLVSVEWGSVRRLLFAKDAACSTTDSCSCVDPERVVGVVWTPAPHADGGSSEERTLCAPLVVVSDGMFSCLRPSLHMGTPPRTLSHFCGYILHHAPADSPLPYPNRGHVFLTSPSPVLMYQIAATETRVLVDVAVSSPMSGGSGGVVGDDPAALAGYMTHTIAPQLPLTLREPFLTAVSSQEGVVMPNRALTGTASSHAGAVMVGDTLNMRHPLTGGGMTVALKDVECLSRCLLSVGGGVTAIDAACAAFQTQRIPHSATINLLANALHGVFTVPRVVAGEEGGSVSTEEPRQLLRAAAVAYMSRGGAYAAGPIGLLSGLTPSPNVLVAHFFAVAALALRSALEPFPPTLARVQRAYRVLHAAVRIIMPLLAAERVTVLAWGPVQLLVHLLFPWRGKN